MNWPALSSLQLAQAIPPDYTLDILHRSDIPMIIQQLHSWYPDIVVGAESCHLDPRFFEEECVLKDDPGSAARSILPLILKHGTSIVLFLSLERDPRAGIITARLGSIDPAHRGMKLAYLGPALLEALGRASNCGMAYYTATLKIPHQQRVAENMGFRLVGILPAFDQNMVRSGEVRRVFEAIYAKVLVDDSQLEWPQPENLTEQTRTLFNLLFPRNS